MSGWCLPNPAAVTSENFSSTPLKLNETKFVQIPNFKVGDGVLPEDDDTYSLLSPIYHDSYESGDDEDDDISATQEPPRVEEEEEAPSEQIEPESLTPWEMWLLNKAKEDKIKIKKKLEEAHFLKEKEAREEVERKQKKMLEEKKIRDWQKLKKEQEKQDQLVKTTKEETEARLREEKQRETEKKAQQKYKDWLHKKNQERLEKEKKQKEQASLKEEQEKERRRKAEQTFKEWLAKNNEKLKASPKTPCSSPFVFHPPPSFYNPIPWKPIHTPPPDSSLDDQPVQKSHKRRGQSSYSAAYRISRGTYR
ncbi:coiled-coil domain-containing protein 34 isoform X2 [Corythoichthys intestinalis]|nr:coiled-coil domain-containing protein 34 isoform X2 [Corythoichthys intestinalis]XP_057692191.1 coiled-coil domain-containing protein 34 isoform X2 [Corythoichthys intestinalis]